MAADQPGWVWENADLLSNFPLALQPEKSFHRSMKRGEVTHWTALACSPLFSYGIAARMADHYVAGLLLNLPCIVIQRYNLHLLVRRISLAEANRSSES
jgi:hypothetical protein